MRTDLLPTHFDKMLARVVEESGEVLQAIGKIQRFGYFATDQKTGISYDNILDLENELIDLGHAIEQARLNLPRRT